MLELIAALALNSCPLHPAPGEEWADDLEPLQTVEPAYPRRAALLGARAICWISFDIDAGGEPANYCTRCTARVDPAPEAELTRRAAALAAHEFAVSSRMAISQWHFGPEHAGKACSRQAFVFLLNGQSEADLPAEPRETPCLEQPQS